MAGRTIPKVGRFRVKFVDRSRQSEKTLREAALSALIVAAEHVVQEAIALTFGGFKTGAFVTDGWKSITFDIDERRMVARVGSTLDHFMYWELGHLNLFTADYEHNPWLTNAIKANPEERQRLVDQAVGKIVRNQGIASIVRNFALRSVGGAFF